MLAHPGGHVNKYRPLKTTLLMTKKANRKAISKQKSKKVTQNPSNTQFPVSETFQLQKDIERSLEAERETRQKHLALQKEYIESLKYNRERFIDLREQINALHIDFKALVKNYNPQVAKEKISAIEALKESAKASEKKALDIWKAYVRSLKKGGTK